MLSSLTWESGRRLTAATTTDGISLIFSYDMDGLRLSKTVAGTAHKYIWQGDRLVSEAWGNEYIEFFYDESGTPSSFYYNNSSSTGNNGYYYYVTNLQGDIVGIRNSSGGSVATYEYDAWGKLISPAPAAGSIGAINPLRYRGYYFDSETGLYYLQSRYYDPEVCRFINADGLILSDRILGYNLLAYCENSPVIHSDTFGFGKTYAIVYDSEKSGFVEQAENSPYYNEDSDEVVVIYVTSNQEFIDAWNGMCDDIDYVYLYLHGGVGVLYFYQEELRFEGDKNETSSLTFSDLSNKKVNKKIYLFSCDGGKGKLGENVAFMFAELADSKVYACTGHVSYSKIYGDYYARPSLKPWYFGFWHTFFFHDSYLFSDMKYAVIK